MRVSASSVVSAGFVCLIALECMCAPGSAHAGAPLSYQVQDLGILGTGDAIHGAALNDQGVAIGSYAVGFDCPMSFQPWRWSSGEGLQSLTSDERFGEMIAATVLNSEGLIVGAWIENLPFPTCRLKRESSDDKRAAEGGFICSLPLGTTSFPSTGHAFAWSDDLSDVVALPTLADLLTLPDHGTAIWAVNRNGVMLGEANFSRGFDVIDRRPFFIDETGIVHDLSHLGTKDAFHVGISDMNDRGLITGAMEFDFHRQAFLADADHVIATLPDVDPDTGDLISTWTVVINQGGVMLGYGERLVDTGETTFGIPICGGALIEFPLYQIQPLGLFIWDGAPAPTYLGEFTPTAINDRGDILASGLIVGSGPASYLYQDGEWHDLSFLIEQIRADAVGRDSPFNQITLRGVDINNHGQILAIVRFDGDGVLNPFDRTYLLTPQPTSPMRDLDGDGVVAFADLLILLAAWGPCGSGSCPTDLDASGDVDFADLLILLDAWSSSS